MPQQLLDMASAHSAALMWAGGLSAALFAATIVLVPWLVARAPQDYFVREGQSRRGAGALAIKIVRNVLGLGCIAMGALMIFIPGPGILTIVIGLSLVDVPGKRELIRRIVQRPGVWRALTHLRERKGAPPFEHP